MGKEKKIEKIEKCCLSLSDLGGFEKKLLKYNLLSKLFCYAIFVIIHFVVKDQHDFKNMTEFFFDSQSDTIKGKILYFFMGFAKWDGVMFLKIYFQGYDNLALHAFFPGFPFILKVLLGPFESLLDGESLTIALLITGILLNLTLNLVNNVFIFRLAKLLKKNDENFAKVVGVLFALGPSGFYHVIFYTESLYLFIYLSSLLYIYHLVLEKKAKIGDLPFWKLSLLAIFFASAGFIRSVGFLSAAHLCYPLLLEFFQDLKKLKIVQSIEKIFKIIFLSCIFLAPFISIQFYVYKTYCKNDLVTNKPSFCNDKIPNYYSYIQKEYWRVEPFSFIKHGKYEEAIFIILSFPVWAHFILKFTFHSFKRLLNIMTAFIPKYIKQNYYDKEELMIFPNYVILLVLGIFSFVSANLCSVDRFMSAIPHYYIILAEFYFSISKSKIKKYLFFYLIATHFTFNIFSFTSLWQPS